VRNRAPFTSCSFVAALLVGLGLGACAEGVGVDEGSGYATLAPVEEDTQRWCARWPNPLTCKDPQMGDGPNPWSCTDPADEGQVDEPPPLGGDPKGCACAGPELDALLNTLLSNGEVVIDEVVEEDEDLAMLPPFREIVYAAAKERCDELVGAMNPQPDFNNCDFALAQHLGANPGSFPPLYKEGTIGDCVSMSVFGDDAILAGVEVLPTDGYRDYYSLSSAITYSTMQQKYIIDAAFFAAMRDNPGWLFGDGTRIEPISNDYQLTGVSSGTIAHALGLQNGDRPRAINGHSVTTIAELLAAYEALQSATSFNFTISRGGSIITIGYLIEE
jgi:hypothetical protein